jgi:hypothetical protein
VANGFLRATIESAETYVYSTSATTVPGAGTFTVGLCGKKIAADGDPVFVSGVNGLVQVTN